MQTYKKVITNALVSTTVTTAYDLALGVDNTTLGQTSTTDATLPTGAKISGARIQQGIGNLTAGALQVAVTFQYLLANQVNVPSLNQGGNNQRNQVLKTWHKILAPDEQFNIDTYIRIPRKFQRLREGMRWRVVIESGGFARSEGSIYIVKAKY